jgi:hypothetical protein
MIESRTVLPATGASLGKMRWHGLPSLPVPTTTLPLASLVLMQLNGTLPQINVGRVPTAMRLRPYDAPKEPGTANAGTLSLSMYCTLC